MQKKYVNGGQKLYCGASAYTTQYTLLTPMRLNSTAELRRLGVGGVNTIRNYLTTTADGFGRQLLRN